MQLRSLVPALSCFAIITVATPGAAQQDAVSASPLGLFVSVGPSQASRRPDGWGVHAEVGVKHPLGHGFGVQLEGTRHAYAPVALPPCGIQDAAHCYQTLDRQVSAGILDLVYDHPITRGSVYLLAGAGIYGSRRVATRYPSCEVGGLCETTTYELETRDSQAGVNGGIGAQLPLGIATLFGDVRVHYVARTSPAGGPSNDYFLLPLTVGLRF